MTKPQADLPDGPLPHIKLHFAKEFARWGISLPEKDVAARTRGKIIKQGWAIWYLFGSDESGEFLDYYASHRRVEDDHIRVYEDGRTEDLPANCGLCRGSMDPVEDARLKKEHFAEEREISAMLKAKGFGIEGDEPGGVQIQNYLRTTEPED